jgi:transcriptional regulator with XRE-family HTH domain
MRIIDPVIGRRLAAIREHRMMSQSELAATIKVTRGAIWNYEHGYADIKSPRLDELARALYCRVEDILAPVEAPLPRARFRGSRAAPALTAEPATQVDLKVPYLPIGAG